uniref:Uncharacterized protein n=1 Tax=Anguilla anguilla TaxID=7936 RepID=A0A0E9SQZ3_ANGAN
MAIQTGLQSYSKDERHSHCALKKHFKHNFSPIVNESSDHLSRLSRCITPNRAEATTL